MMNYNLKNIFTIILISLFLFSHFIQAQDVVINEVMSSNATMLPDDDGDYPDWIELYNAGTSTVDIGEWGLSDDADELLKWQFPEVEIAPNEYLLVFASGKDRKNFIAEWETIITRGDSCRYLNVQSSVTANWIQNDFDDSQWEPGKTGLGYGDGDDSTVIMNAQCLYLRQNYDVHNLSVIEKVFLHVDFDDAFVAYLNGSEIARANIGSPGVRPEFDESAYEPREAEMYQGGAPLKYEIENYAELLLPGKNVLAIEVHNFGSYSSDMSIIPFLSMAYSEKKINSRGAEPLLNLPDSDLHTNFKIKSSGETLFLSNATEEIIDTFPADSIPTDISKGRYPNGSSEWYFFDKPTPGFANAADGYQNFAPQVKASLQSGFYNGSVTVSLFTEEEDSLIYYTLNGAVPDSSSARYQNSVHLTKTSVIKARVLKYGSLPGKILTQTYFINEDIRLPVVSLSTDPAHLWDYENGIYVMGPNASPDFPHFGANFWEDWERAAHIEFFEDDGRPAFSAGCGVKIFGGWSRGFPQKSLSLFFRSQYGMSTIEYPLFPSLDISSFEALVLRNSGNDWDYTMLRDGMMTSLLSETDVDLQAFRPAVLFINGQYWGIHNIREKINEHFIASHHSVDANNIDLLEGNQGVIHGDNEHYQQIIDFIKTHDMNSANSYNFIMQNMEISEFLDYVIAQIYFDNTDWPGNNIKYWRPKTPQGKWRWILFDTDFSFGLYDESAWQNNTLAFALAENGPEWPNPPWSTFLLRKILENTRLRNQFIDYFADHLNETFKATRALEKIAEKRQTILAEIPAHKQRWSQDEGRWHNEVERLNTFARNRVAHSRMHLMQQFNLSAMNKVKISLADSTKGKIVLNEHIQVVHDFEGYYFPEIQISVKAIANPGYRFIGWSGSNSSQDTEIEFFPYGNINLQANFEKAENLGNAVVINEINYNSAENFDSGDWLEFVNISEQAVDMSGWVFKDEDNNNEFIFPGGFILQSDSFVVLVGEESKFTSKFPHVQNYLSGMDFGLKGSGELVRLYNAGLKLVDSLVYDDKSPWPEKADGNGASLELLNPRRDNALAENWAASAGHGSPGKQNSVYTDIPNESPLQAPRKFFLHQNFPNPFNPETIIKYSIDQPGQVTLKVYDIRGRRVDILVNAFQKPGEYEVFFNGSQISGGIYFYKITFNHKLMRTQKMVLIR